MGRPASDPGANATRGDAFASSSAHAAGARTRVAAAAVALAACSALAREARADAPATADVTVVRHGVASGCPGGAALAARIDAVAGRRATVGTSGVPADVRVAITFAPSPSGGLVAALEATGARTGLRSFVDDDVDCTALAEAVAVATALLLDAGRELAVPLPPPAPPPADAAAPAVPPAAEPLRDGDARPNEPATDATFSLGAPTWAVDAWTAFSTTLDAGGTASLSAMGRRRFGAFSIGAGVAFVLPAEVRFGSGFVSAWAVGATTQGCLDVRIEDLETTLSPCAAASLRSVLAAGDQYDENYASALPMVGLGGALALASRLRGPVSVLIHGAVEGEVVRPTFRVDDLGGADPGTVGEAYRPSAVSVEVGAGLRIEAP